MTERKRHRQPKRRVTTATAVVVVAQQQQQWRQKVNNIHMVWCRSEVTYSLCMLFFLWNISFFFLHVLFSRSLSLYIVANLLISVTYNLITDKIHVTVVWCLVFRSDELRLSRLFLWLSKYWEKKKSYLYAHLRLRTRTEYECGVNIFDGCALNVLYVVFYIIDMYFLYSVHPEGFLGISMI